LAIVKSTSPANSGTDSFAYSTTNLTPGSFSLDTNPSTATSNEQDFNNLSDFTTTKTVKETLTTGWDLTGISCTGAASGEVTYGTSLTASSNTDTTWQTGDTAVSVAISPGESVQCTYTNKLLPKIVIVKNAKPAQGVFSFDTTGSTSGSGTSWPTGTSAFTLTGSTSGGGNTRTFTVDPGTYTVTEQTQLSWTLTGIGGSTDPLHPYDCVVTGSGGSTGSGVSQGSLTPLDTRTVSITIAYGDTVRCTFENTGNGATRTQGFWATHPQLANIAWFGGTEFGHTFPGVTNVSGIGNMTFCSPVTKDMSVTTGTPAEGLRRVMGGFWSSISSKSSSFNPPNQKRTTIDQYRMQLVQQLLAAELNASAFGSLPSSGTFSAWESAYCGSSQTAIKTAQQQAASFNSQGDNSNFTPGTSASSKYARSIANIPYWDVLP
ncbi:MAG TPA: hypothetical protein VFL58_03090, partial [Gaiellaceae bacterium]|nr:hypothetical protein [Gaiellaceae bacterium]